MDRYKETFDTWNNVAKQYENKFMDLDIYNNSYDFFCQSISTQNARILELGCGPGNISKYILSKKSDFEIFGIDIAPNMIELAKKNNPTAKFEQMDIRQIHNINTKYEGIICGFCLPYLSKLESNQLIENCNSLLNKNGLIYLSFVNGNPGDSGFQVGKGNQRVYFNFHNLDSILEKLSKCDFDLLKKFNVKYKISENEFDEHTILVAKKTITNK